MKDDIVLEVNRFNANMLMNLDEDGDGGYEENGRRKNSLKNSKSQSSLSTSINDQVRDTCFFTNFF